MRPNLFIRQLCCMPRSNPRTNVPFKDSIMIVPICSKIIHSRQSLWIENTLQNIILDVKKLSKRQNRNVFAFVPDHSNLQWFQPWREFYLGLFQASFVFFIRNSLSSLKMKIHRIAPDKIGKAYVNINKRYHAIFLSWWLGYKLNIASIKIRNGGKHVHFIFECIRDHLKWNEKWKWILSDLMWLLTLCHIRLVNILFSKYFI